MSDYLQRLRGILGHELPDDFIPDNWHTWYEVVQSSAQKYPERPGVANALELLGDACSSHATDFEEAIYKWDTHSMADLLEKIRLYKTARYFVESHSDGILSDIDWSQVPRAYNEKDDRLALYDVWTIDEAGMCLVGPEADQLIVHIDELLNRPPQRSGP
jgi:hypothetical protein